MWLNPLVLQRKVWSLCAGNIKAVFVVTAEENHWEELGIGSPGASLSDSG